MKLTNQKRENGLPGGNEVELIKQSDRTLGDTPYYYLLQLIAQMCDEQATGTNIYMSIGATRKGDAHSLTLKSDDGSNAVYQPTLVELAEDCQNML